MPKESTTSTLGRVRANVERAAAALAVGRGAMPQLAMGSDTEGLVHLGIDAQGDIVRMDLDPGWRHTLAPDGLGTAVSEALHDASQVRVGDWAGALVGALDVPAQPQRTRTQPVSTPVLSTAIDGVVVAVAESGATAVTIDPTWAAASGDAEIRRSVLAALAAGPRPAVHSTGSRRDVSALQGQALGALSNATKTLPEFMRGPVQRTLDDVDDDVRYVLQLPVTGEAVAASAIDGYANDVTRCLVLAGRPAGLPEASEQWAVAALSLTDSLAATRRSGSPFRRRSWGGLGR